jgi:hypothetical protein
MSSDNSESNESLDNKNKKSDKARDLQIPIQYYTRCQTCC